MVILNGIDRRPAKLYRETVIVVHHRTPYNITGMRLFTAIELPRDVRERLVEAQSELKLKLSGKISWTAPQNLHVTLKFLGEVSDADVVRVRDALRSIAIPRFSISISQLGTFPPRGPARVLMADVAEPTELLVKLFDAIEDVCEPVGFAREQRAFHPHVTLARLRAPRRISRELESVRLKPLPAFEIREFVLMESRLTAVGSEYQPVSTVALL